MHSINSETKGCGEIIWSRYVLLNLYALVTLFYVISSRIAFYVGFAIEATVIVCFTND
jgi:hypothetical protein